MDFTGLYVFSIIAKYEHLTKAAEELHISQPALSRTLSELEKRLGVALFERRRGKIRLNSMGKIYQHYVEIAISAVEEGEKHLRELAKSSGNYITVATPVRYMLPAIVEVFLEEKPGMHISQHFCSDKEIHSLLSHEEIDFAVATEQSDDKRFVWEPVFPEHLFLLTGKSHQFAQRSRIALRELAEERFLCNFGGLGVDFVDRLCKMEGFSPSIIDDTAGGKEIIGLLRGGYGAALVPYWHIATQKQFEDMDFGTYALLEGSSAPRTIGIISFKDRILSEPALAFKGFVREYLVAFAAAQARFIKESLG